MTDSTISGMPETATLSKLLSGACQAIPPLWPLQDFVAVNPFSGLAQHDFLVARQELWRLRHADLLMPLEYFQAAYQQGSFTETDVVRAIEECEQADSTRGFGALRDRVLRDLLARTGAVEVNLNERVMTPAELADHKHGTHWNATIVQEVSKHCAAHFDRGQASWSSPWKHLPLYEAWRRAAAIDRRMEQLGARGFRDFVASLPATAEAALAKLLVELEIPRSAWLDVLQRSIYSVAGWASYLKYRCSYLSSADASDEADLVGLIAVRLAYDVGLRHGIHEFRELDLRQAYKNIRKSGQASAVPEDVLTRLVLQVAHELGGRRKLLETLQAPRPQSIASARKLAQLVFCIDVRSELMRRHIESLSDSVETFGFAGFFGLPFEFVPLGQAAGTAQCPVLLQPAFTVHETVPGMPPAEVDRTIAGLRLTQVRQAIWKGFQSSGSSCFSFAETVGPLFLGKLFEQNFLRPRRQSVDSSRGHQQRLRPTIGPVESGGLSTEARIQAAKNILSNLGLTENFARLVVFVGHGSETANNPYKAGLDCGACGGHTGEVNARVAAELLNDPRVRDGLRQSGVEMPTDVWFLAALHNTTTDELSFFDLEQLPASHAEEFGQLCGWTTRAGELVRNERALRLGAQTGKALRARAGDWSEVRPEWGLAGNAAFIAAPRTRTLGKNLAGRAFLHSYDFRQDPEFKVLELIMTAPMIVANWINLQYYASVVDNQVWGSGNKVLHNVTGTWGVLEGNGGDLRTGLPWQSVHDGRGWQHDPLRLLVVIEAPRTAIGRIVSQHEQVRHLVCNRWLTMIALDQDECYRLTEDLSWEEQAFDQV
jgi:uncharacterized protein YbcC (UPF0753/DUF2309 family)